MSMKRCRSRLAVGVAVVALTATGPAALAAPFTSLYSPASAALVGQTIRVLPFVGSDDPSNTGPIRPNVSSGVCPTIVSFEAPQLEFDMIGSSDSQAEGISADGNVYSWRPILPKSMDTKNSKEAKDSQEHPAAIESPEDDPFIDLAVGPTHAVAATSEGEVYAWGTVSAGSLGDKETSSADPVHVEFPTDEDEDSYFYDGIVISSVAAGDSFSLALTEEGQLYGWGANDSGQLGDASFTNRSTPVAVNAPEDVTFSQITAGARHTVALDSDGNAYAWGSNKAGQLGNGTNSFSAVPTSVSMPKGVTFSQVVASGDLSAAIGSDGSVYLWGTAEFPLGDSGAHESNVPVPVLPPEGVAFSQVSVASGHALAIDTDGVAYAWGLNDYGKLGAGNEFGTKSLTPVPVAVPEGTRLTEVAAGRDHSIGLTTDGHIFAWGKPYWEWTTASSGYTDAKRYGVPRQEDPAEITAVGFSRVPGSGITRQTNGPWPGTYQVTTPELPAGKINVRIDWAVGDAEQEPVIHYGAFTYTSSIVMTNPEDQTAEIDERVLFSVDTTVCESQPATWEYSDDGETWRPITRDRAAQIDQSTNKTDAIGLWVRPDDLTYDGRLYRVTVSNEYESVTSEPARLTVTEKKATAGLPVFAIAGGVAALAVIGAGIWWFVARRRR